MVDLPPAVKLLDAKDQLRYITDLQAYGFAMCRTNDDGTVTYIPPSTWLRVGEGRRRRAWLLNTAYGIARTILISSIVCLGVLVLFGLLEPK